MIASTLIPHLIEEHGDIRRLAAELAAFLEGERAPVDPAFAACRWLLMRRLTMHLAHERQVMAELAQSGSGPRLASSADVTLEEGLRAHMAEWTGAKIATSWPTYRAVTRALLHRLAQRIAHEEGVIFPRLAQRYGGTNAGA